MDTTTNEPTPHFDLTQQFPNQGESQPPQRRTGHQGSHDGGKRQDREAVPRATYRNSTLVTLTPSNLAHTSDRGRKSGNSQPENNSSTNRPNGYIITWEKVTKVAADYIEGRLDEHPTLTDHDRHLFKHILISGSTWTSDNTQLGWVPVAWRLLDYKLQDANPNHLIEAGLIESDEDYTKGEKSLEYRVVDEVRDEYTRLVRENMGGPYVNIFTGKRTVRKHKSNVTDSSGNKYPKLIKDAMEVIQYGYFNRAAVERHIDQLEAKRDARRRELEEAKAKYPEDSKAFKQARDACIKANGLYTNDVNCWATIEKQNPEHIYGDVFRYKVAYRPTMSGRLSFIGGGAQSCSREMKEAMYEGVKHVRNYDIKGSQVAILREKLIEAGLSTKWIDQYVSNPRAKYEYAELVGLTVDTWKKVFLARIMGGGLRRRDKTREERKGNGFAIFDKIADEVGLDRVDEVMDQFEEVIGGLNEVLNEWHDYLIDVWLPEHVYWVGGKRYVRNATGTPLCIDDIPAGKLPRKLAAYILQGEEAAFIHRLTKLSEGYLFTPIANEHDGLVTLGEIPDEAIERVRVELDMPYIRLVEKDFV